MKLRDIRSLVNVEGPPRSVAERLARTCHNVDDVRKLAAKRLPRSVFDYLDGGAEDEVSLRRNRLEFRRLVLRTALGRNRKPRSEHDGAGQADDAAPHPVADRGHPALPLGRRSRRRPCGVGDRHSVRIGAPEHHADGVDHREHP